MEFECFVTKNLARKYIRLTKEQKNNFILEAKNGNRASKEKIFSSMYLYVIRMAWSYCSKYNIALEDLISCGLLGLDMAIEKFNPSLGFSFITFAHHYIRKYMEIEAKTKSYAVYMPIITYFDQKKRGKIPIGIVVSSLNTKSINCDIENIENVRGEENEPIEAISALDMVNKLKGVLNEREKAIIKYNFEQNLDFEQIGKMYGLSRERIRQIKETAMEKMRKHFKYLNSIEQKGIIKIR